MESPDRAQPQHGAAPPLILIEALHKQYREVHAVRGVSAEVHAGQILGLVGPNGAGKTTTMRAACGIIPPSSGRVLIAGHDVVLDPVAAKSRLAWVPDDPSLFGSLTVWEHLRFTAAAYRLDGSFEAKATSLLERFELTPKRDELAQNLSRGMRQKVAITCAYLHEPQVLFFDEPLIGLDPRGIRTMKDSMRQRAAEGACVIISSHLLSLVEDMCTHILVLQAGRVVFAGSLADARAAAERIDGVSTLEDFFFHLTETPGREAGTVGGAGA